MEPSCAAWKDQDKCTLRATATVGGATRFIATDLCPKTCGRCSEWLLLKRALQGRCQAIAVLSRKRHASCQCR